MTSLPFPESNRHAVYTGRATSWPMVASTSLGSLLVVVMGTQAEGAWNDLWLIPPLVSWSTS